MAGPHLDILLIFQLSDFLENVLWSHYCSMNKKPPRALASFSVRVCSLMEKNRIGWVLFSVA